MKFSNAPEKATMNKSGANKAAMDEINARSETRIIVRQIKYLNNIVEQDHRAVKRVTKPMLNFKSFRTARNVLAGIELMHVIRKGQLMMEECNARFFADQFYVLAGNPVPFEELASVPTQNTFINWQRDRATTRTFRTRPGSTGSAGA